MSIEFRFDILELLDEMFESWRDARSSAARVIKHMPRSIWRRGVEVTLSLVENPSDRRSRLIEVSAVPFGDPALVASGDVKVTRDGLGVVARLYEPVVRAQVDAAIERVAAVASTDPALAAKLAALPDATPLVGSELSPGVELSPDGLRIGLLAGRLVAVLDGVHQFLPRDVRLGAAIEKLRTFVRGGDASPYR